MKTRKCTDITVGGCHIEVIFHFDLKDRNEGPYRIYRVDANHRKLIAKCSDYLKVLAYLQDMFQFGIYAKSMVEHAEWSKATGSL